MQTVYSPRHAGHGGNVELILRPRSRPPSSCRGGPRSSWRGCGEVGLGPVPRARRARPRHRAAGARARLSRVPAAGLAAEDGGGAGAARRCPSSGRCRACAPDVPPADIDGLLGFYAMDAGATFVEGTWDAVKSSHDVALTGADLVRAASRRPSRSAGRRATMPTWASLAATAMSTTRRSPPESLR